MNEIFSRTSLLLGDENMEKLHTARVAVFGLGGVGGYALEALVRGGVGSIDIIDNDTIDKSNLNRQIISQYNNIGERKTDVAEQRAKNINPDITIVKHDCFFMPENADSFDFSAYDYVIDAIDTVSAKIELVLRCEKSNTPIISAMGAGNKLDATAFEVTDIYKTQTCPLARVMRYELRKRGIKKLKVVYSREEAIKPKYDENTTRENKCPGSVSYVPGVVGLIIAGEVIKDLTDCKK